MSGIPRIWIPQFAAQALEIHFDQGGHETISLDEDGWADLGVRAAEGRLEFRYRSRRLLTCRLNEVRSVLETAVVLKAATCRGVRTDEESGRLVPVGETALFYETDGWLTGFWEWEGIQHDFPFNVLIRTEEGELVYSRLDVLPASEEQKRRYHRTYAHTVWMERGRVDRKGLRRYRLELADWTGRVWTSKAFAIYHTEEERRYGHVGEGDV